MVLVFFGMLTWTIGKQHEHEEAVRYGSLGICSHDNVPYAAAEGMGVMGTVSQQDATVQVLLKRITRSIVVKYLKKSLSVCQSASALAKGTSLVTYIPSQTGRHFRTNASAQEGT
jgi:hypothetical protein